MNFYNLALGIANGNRETLEYCCRIDYISGMRVYLSSTEFRSRTSMMIPDAKKGNWFSFTSPYLKNGKQIQINDIHATGKFFEDLSRCQTIADLILATSGEINNVETFKISLEIIRLRASTIPFENPFKHNLNQATTRVINLCKEFFTLKNGGISSRSPFFPLDGDGMVMPSTPSAHFTDKDLLDWASSLSPEQKEKVLFFDFNNYPMLTEEIPLKIKLIFPNLSLVCFGALPDSMCDVTLMGDLKLEEVEGDYIEKEGKGKEKEVWSEEKGEFYFPDVHKRKSSYLLKNPCVKKQKLDDGDSEKTKKEVDSEKKPDVNQLSRPAGIKANRRILASSSEFFNQLFYGGFNEENQKEIVLKDVDPRILELTLDAFFLRTDLEGRELETLFEIYKTAFYLGLHSARALAEAQIIRQLEDPLDRECFAENESEKEKEAEGNSGVERATAVEEIIQKLGQYYLDLGNVFSMEPKNLLKRAIIKFLRNNLFFIHSASYKELFIRFLEANLPLAEMVKNLRVSVSDCENDLDILYDSLWQASLELQGQSFKKILSLCRKHWEKGAFDNSLERHLKCVEVCINMNSPIQIKRILFASLLKAAQVGDGLKNRPRPLIGRKGKGGKEISDKFLAAATCLMKSIKGDFEDPKINTNIKKLFSDRLMVLSNMAVDPEEIQIRAQLAFIASKVNPENKQAHFTYLSLKNPKWDIEKEVDYGESMVQPENALTLLRLVSPPEVSEIDTLDNYATWGASIKDPNVLFLCSVLHYYEEVQNWDKIFETSYLALKYNPECELALSLYGASLIQYAKVKPDQKEDLLSQAKQNLDLSLMHNPKNTIALTYLANWHLAKEEFQQAKDIFKTIKHQTLTTDNFDLIKQLLLGNHEEAEAGLKILRRTLKNKNNQIMDHNWFNLMAILAIKIKDINLLLKFKTFFEDCIDAKIYVPATLFLLNWIYEQKSLIGPVEEEKKKKLIEAGNNVKDQANISKFYRTTLLPTRHPADCSLGNEGSILQILELDEPSPLPDFDLEEFLFSLGQ
ncbi:BTB/POZ domain-containing protein [Criblamydia sequanensis]|uniref:BTB domain-containing protein n=1 Tax=Candidatus Criblamydia sequanensis CRIB-18 TaxID=1437425 RepID=A0A090DVZ6_9BACT|nr:BTB/POZ domain-containing protein [Criblamydia sequanensis]CDR33109.1 hypothetical protein CSEC_0270 [Criblamydia sequanensis CRIB-18]